MFLELDKRQDTGFTVSLEWNRDSGEAQIVVDDNRPVSLFVLPVPGADGSDAFRHPLRYAP